MKTILLSLFMLPLICGAQIILPFAGCSCGLLGDGGPDTNALIEDPGQMVFDRFGNLYIPEGTANRVRKIDTLGIISTVAGTGEGGYSGDGGAATAASLNFPDGVAVDATGNIFIADEQNSVIRKVNVATGIITTVCGDGSFGYLGDGGPATLAKIYGPNGITVDNAGNLLIADCNNNVIRRVDTAGIITTVAGTGIYGYNGDGIPATSAKLYLPTDVKTDDSDNIYIADMNARIRKVDRYGIITTYAGNGNDTYIGDSMAATYAQFSPSCICFDSSYNLYISDQGITNLRVYKVERSTGLFYTVAGDGNGYNAGDYGPATNASFANFPSGVATDKCGNLYVGNIDSSPDSDRIREVIFTDSANISLSGTSAAIRDSGVSIMAIVGGVGSYKIHWYDNGILVATTTTTLYTYTMTSTADTITATVVSAGGCFDSVTSAPHIVTVKDNGVPGISQQVISVYPNPAHISLTITGSLTEVMLINTIGQTLITQQGSGNKAIVDISALPPGMYLLEVTGDDGNKSVHKVVKE